MNRSARCIQMLQLLKSRGFLTREQIADELQTNVRNIAEFRKELEAAGYIIASTTGKYGGYQLLNACLLPSTKFTQEEQHALKELQEYLASHPDFRMRKEVNHALDKVMGDVNVEDSQQGFYLEHEQYVISPQVKDMIQMVEEARREHHVVELNYRTLKEKQAHSVQVHPYEIINYKGAYYCLGYSMKAKDFRNYKFSEERMKAVHILPNTFVRDHDFNIKHHIGKTGLIKDEVLEVVLHVYGDVALLVAEKHIGMHPTSTWLESDVLLFTTYFESMIEAKSFVLSLGSNAKVLQPLSLCKTIAEEVAMMQNRYKSKDK